VIAHEVTMVEALGAEIRYGVTVGKDISMDELEDQGYQAIFLGAGAPESSAMRCTGEEAGYQGFMPGIDFLARAARGNTPLAGKRVVVIGGGNVAMDCVRTARRLGFEDVNLLYRRTETEMPADRHEIREAKEEGVTFHFLVAPLEIMAENGVVTGLKCQRMGLGEPDASGRRRPMPIDGSEFVIDCDAVIPAVGQKGAMNQVISGEDCVTSWNTLMVDEATFQSARPQVFGGGDCATGPASLIAALAAGRKAAGFIDQYLKTRVCCSADRDVLEHLVSEGRVFDHEPDFTFPGGTVREEQPVMEPDERICDFQEVEKGFSAVQARIEASRCLRCYRLLVASF
jgi:formate dehydrogenase beta subunit